MLIFMIIVMGPALGFMIYVLRQFRCEAMRPADPPEAELPWSVTAATAPDPLDQENPRRARNVPARRIVVASSPAARKSGSVVTGPAHGKVVAMHLKSRVIEPASNVEQPAEKRAAKGSS